MSSGMGIAQAYLAECMILRILNEEAPEESYPELHEETGLALLEIEEAVEDKPFLLHGWQLEEGLKIHESKGIGALVIHLHESFSSDQVGTTEAEEEGGGMVVPDDIGLLGLSDSELDQFIIEELHRDEESQNWE